MTTPCSCGCAATHKVATRQTADGKSVSLWSDGMVTFALGLRVRGAGVARFECERRLNVRAGWLVMDLVGMFDAAQIAALVTESRREVRRQGASAAESCDLSRNIARRMRG